MFSKFYFHPNLANFAVLKKKKKKKIKTLSKFQYQNAILFILIELRRSMSSCFYYNTTTSEMTKMFTVAIIIGGDEAVVNRLSPLFG